MVGRKKRLDNKPMDKESSIIFICPNCEVDIDIPIRLLQGGLVIDCSECDTSIVETKKTD